MTSRYFISRTFQPLSAAVIGMWLIAALALAQIPTVWKYRKRTGGWPLIALLISIAIWNVFSSLEFLSPSVQVQVYWMRFTYVGVSMVPSLSLLAARIFCGDDRSLPRVVYATLIGMPVLTMIFTFTTHWNGLMWNPLSFVPGSGPHDWVRGLWFYIWVVWSIMAFLSTFVVIGRAIIIQRGMFRLQAVSMMGALLLPWIANFLYIYGAETPGLNYYYLTPITTGIATVLFSINRWVFHLLAQMPVARNQVLESMKEGVLVLSDDLEILDANPALCKLAGISRHELIGHSLNRDFPMYLEPMQLIRETEESLDHELFLEGLGYMDVHISPLHRLGQPKAGWVVLFQDINNRKQTELALAEAHTTIETLGELVPICAWCGSKIQQEDGTWITVDKYIEQHSKSEMTHGICPECHEKHFR